MTIENTSPEKFPKSDYFSIAVGLCITFALAFSSIKYGFESARDIFYKDAVTIASNIEVESNKSLQPLLYMNAFYNASDEVLAGEFNKFSAPILKDNPNIQALEWIPVVSNKNRYSFEKKMRKIFTDFQITEKQKDNDIIRAEQRENYFPISFIYPITGNEVAHGYDLGSDPDRFLFLQQTRDSGSLKVTQPIRLVQDEDSYGVLVIEPVYKKNVPNITKKQRRENLIGFLLAVYKTKDIIEQSISYYLPPGIHIELSDNDHENGNINLFISPSSSTGKGHKISNKFYYEYDFNFANRNWHLLFRPISGYYKNTTTTLTLSILLLGLISTFIVFLYFRSLNKNMLKTENIKKQLLETNRQLKTLSHMDSLLNIANRYSYEKYLKKEWSRSLRNQSNLSMLMIDVDHFKLYNDTFGHTAGDTCLKKVASIIKNLCVRPADFVARYGGEEIAVILPDTNIDGATQLAQTICTSIYNESIPHHHSPAAAVVTVSIGVGSIIPSKYDLPVNFVTHVDEQLYHAKRQGRNQVSAVDLKNVTHTVRAG